MKKRRFEFTVSFEATNWQDADAVRASISALGVQHFMGLTCTPLMIECDTRPDSEVFPSGERPAIGFTPVNIDPQAQRLYLGYKKAKWNGKPKRRPLKGDLYLSGAVVVAYAAPENLSAEYFIAVPTKEKP